MHPLRLARRLPPRLTAPLALPLDRQRARHVDVLLARHPVIVELVQHHLRRLQDAPDAESQRVIGRYTRLLLRELRKHRTTGVLGLAARLDAVVQSDLPELLDAAWLPQLVKRLEMALLDRLNRNLGNYDAWAEAVRQALADATAAQVMDLAAGSGGLARHVAQRPLPNLAGWTTTDLEPLYVAQARKLAKPGAVPIAFAVRDALDLRDLRGRVDLFVCTQSTHHLAPGQVVTMLAQAMASAPRGIVVVDILRSGLNIGAAAVATTLTAPFLPLQVDGMQSVRRSYAPAELTLLARLAGAGRVAVRPMAPAFTVLHAQA